ncbi:hypothetical protein BaRGS_00019866, partial [Batillaria attramentaria]
MSVRDFKGIPSIQEVECWGGALEAGVRLFSLKIFLIPEGTVLAFLEPSSANCVTYSEFSSCFIETSDTRNSRLRVLVPELNEGESKVYGCNATSIKTLDHYKITSWNIVVTRESEYPCVFTGLI